ncbi:hypothetical protein Bbelb_082460 [Branchiostoma belcheri]|nr:hypothetical protein Bbelb_082460 [Branchiostoma belcheri]
MVTDFVPPAMPALGQTDDIYSLLVNKGRRGNAIHTEADEVVSEYRRLTLLRQLHTWQTFSCEEKTGETLYKVFKQRNVLRTSNPRALPQCQTPILCFGDESSVESDDETIV